jgi:hypothetical protein
VQAGHPVEVCAGACRGRLGGGTVNDGALCPARPRPRTDRKYADTPHPASSIGFAQERAIAGRASYSRPPILSLLSHICATVNSIGVWHAQRPHPTSRDYQVCQAQNRNDRDPDVYRRRRDGLRHFPRLSRSDGAQNGRPPVKAIIESTEFKIEMS